MTENAFVQQIRQALLETGRQLGWDETVELPIETPPDQSMGDYAVPLFRLAKSQKKAPPLIAQAAAQAFNAVIQATPEAYGNLATSSSAGPYLNIRIDPAAMARDTLPRILDGTYFTSNRTDPANAERRKKVMVEYSQPNTHKAFHVGHMRNVALGDALLRILDYNGHEVVAANYIGDVGTHIARCLWGYESTQRQAPEHVLDRAEWLGQIYAEAAMRIEGETDEAARKAMQAETSRILQALERDDPHYTALWQETRAWSLAAFEEVYQWLGARFDVVFYESDMERGQQIVDEGLAKGVFAISEGAVGIDLEADGLPWFMVRKSDGTSLYSTKDLALAQIKFEQHGIQESIYVVGAEQTLHFKQVFKTLEHLGYAQAKDCHHLAYGLVMLPDGKMSSRAGNIIPFSRLRREVLAYIHAHYLDAHRGDWPEAEIAETARRIAVAGIRYGMVKQDPSRSIIFALEDWLATEGDTGTYLCYAFTRVQSVLRTAEERLGHAIEMAALQAADLSLLTEENERLLVRLLHDFNETVLTAERTLRPNHIANYLFDLAKEFSRTYVTSPVLKAESEALRDARLALFAATGRVLLQGMHLLGMDPPERM